MNVKPVQAQLFTTPGYTYHVLNRGNARTTFFPGSKDYDAFLELMAESSVRTPMRILAYCLCPTTSTWPCGRARTAS